MPGPLEDISVVELATSVAGPYASLILSELGARVVKVERPDEGGDEARGWKPPSIGNVGVMFAVMNAGKHSVVADLDDAGDQERLRRLLDGADVFITSLREESLEKRGLDAESLQRRSPGLVYARISAFGTDGPLANEPGYDPLVQGFVGLMAVTGEEGRQPVRVGTSIIDMGTGMWTAIGVLSALEERRRTGRGARLDLSLLETGVAWLPYQIAGRQADGREPRRFGSALPMLVPYQAFETAAGHIIVAAGNDRIWRRLCAVLGRDDLAADPDLGTNAQRVERRDRVVDELKRTLLERSAVEWEAALRDAHVPCSVVRTIGEAVAHEQVRATGVLASLEGVDVPAVPFRIDGWRPSFQGGPPTLAEHQRELEEIGDVSRAPGGSEVAQRL